MTEPIINGYDILKYENKTPPWGFNGLGYVVYKRTYARVVEEQNRTEEWIETIARCINGAQDIGADYTKEEALDLLDLMFNLKCSLGGRMLWQLGTSTVKRFGGDSLNNCWFVEIKAIGDFLFLMNELLLGGGVGFSIRREHIHELPKLKKDINIVHENSKDADFIVPDSREGWVGLLAKILKSYFISGKSFTYSTILVRGAGEPIKGFGGHAAGPKVLVDGMSKIIEILKSREGKKLRSLDVLDICNIIGAMVVAGNVRRSAMIALGDPDDFLFIRAKRWDLGTIPNWRSTSNNTVCADNYKQISDEVWSGYEGNGECYGFFNLPLSKSHGRLKDGSMKNARHIYHHTVDNCSGLNPCVVGETKVYVADGRGSVEIKKLAEEEKDVSVFCYDTEGKIVIRYMRHPRVTGYKSRILKIQLDDGSFIRVTENHKIKLKDGQYVEAKDLKMGDSLNIITKFEASIKDIFPEANSRSSDYFFVNNGQKNAAEHRYIAAFNNGPIPKGHVVHHIDFDAQNNAPNNLHIMSRQAHNELHASFLTGDNNPMRRALKEWSPEKWNCYKKKMSEVSSGEKNPSFSGHNNETLKKHALILTKKLNRRFSVVEWKKYAKENQLPYNFSQWRINHLGGMAGFAKWAAHELKMEHIDCDPRIYKLYLRALNEGYDAFIKDGGVMVNKLCEHSGKKFAISWTRREVAYASLSESSRASWLKRGKDITIKIKETYHKLAEKKRNFQLDIFTELSARLQRKPKKKEWIHACEEKNIPFRLGKHSPFETYGDLTNAANFYNHRVVSVVEDGTEDVYNGTVDEFHNFFIGGFEGKLENGKKKWVYLNNLQCGEQTLSDMECCDLVEIFHNNVESKEELFKITKLLYKTAKAVLSLDYIHPETTNIVHKNMRIGMGVTGICQVDDDKLQWLDEAYVNLRKFDVEWSKLKGWNPSIKLTTVKPSGSLSLLAGSTPGVHPAYSKFYIRRVRMASSDIIVRACRKAGYKVEYERKFDGTEDHLTCVVEFICNAGDNSIIVSEMSAVRQLELVKKMQTIWSDNSVSATVYFKKEELSEIKEWLKLNYENSIKSVSFLLHNDHGFDQAPYEEISEIEYKNQISKLKPIIINDNKESFAFDGLECEGNLCPIR